MHDCPKQAILLSIFQKPLAELSGSGSKDTVSEDEVVDV